MIASGSLRLKVTIKSLNHRFFDWAYRGTPLGDVENRLRAICQKRFQRGRIEVFLETNFLDPEIWNFSVNEALLEKVLSSLERVASRLGKPFDLSLDQILKIPQIVDLSRKDIDGGRGRLHRRVFRGHSGRGREAEGPGRTADGPATRHPHPENRTVGGPDREAFQETAGAHPGEIEA